MADLTIKNIKNFIIGNTRLLGSKVNVIDTSLIEQVAWRASKCPDCLEEGKCLHGCGCKVPGRWFVSEPCNPGIHTPLLDDSAWALYKQKHNISFDKDGKLK